MKLFKKFFSILMVCAMMLGAFSLLIACQDQTGMNANLTANETIESQPVVADPEYEVKSVYSKLTNGNGLYYEEVDPSDRRSTDELPAEYTQIEYVESTGKQYINTGYTPNNQTQIEMRFSVPTVTSYVNLFYSTNFYVRNTSCYVGSVSRTLPAYTQNAIYELQLSTTECRLLANGVQTYYTGISSSITSTSSLTLLCFSAGKNVCSAIKLYSFKISEKDPSTSEVTCIKDFVPCVKDNVCGLFDIVGQEFFDAGAMSGCSFNLQNNLQGSGTENAPYQISSVEDLLVFNAFANGTEYYVVTNDIEFNDGYFERNADGTCTYHDGTDGILYDWSAPITFFRKFDGQRHVFKNFYSSHSGLFYLKPLQGLSTSQERGLDICNLAMNGYMIEDNLIYTNLLSVFCSIEYMKINANFHNCEVDVYAICTIGTSLMATHIDSSSQTVGNLKFENCVTRGNIVGSECYGVFKGSGREISIEMKNCENHANIKANNYQAVGITYGGYNTTLENCRNFGNITGYNAAVGFVYTGYTIVLKDCYNYGDVRATSQNTSNGKYSEATGILFAWDTKTYRLNSCGNEGNINSYGVACGICRDRTSGNDLSNNKHYYEDCYNKGSVTSSGQACGISYYVKTAKNCANYGKIKGSSYACGLFFQLIVVEFNFIYNCVNYGEVQGNIFCSGILQQAIAYSTKTTSAFLYNCVNKGKITSNSNSSVGIFGGEVSSSVSNLVIRNCSNEGQLINKNTTGGFAVGIFLLIGSVQSNAKYSIENCSNTGVLQAVMLSGIFLNNISGLPVGRIDIRNCMVGGRMIFTSNNYTNGNTVFVSRHSLGSMVVSVKNCVADCNVSGQRTKQFWGDDFSGFFVNRMNGCVGLKALDCLGKYQQTATKNWLNENGFDEFD